MPKTAHLLWIWLALSQTAMARSETLVLAKLQGVPDQYLGMQVLGEAYRRLGVSLKFKTLPAQRALLLTRTGHIDGEIQRQGGLERLAPELLRVPLAITHRVTQTFARQSLNPESSSMRQWRYTQLRGTLAPWRKHFHHIQVVSDVKQIWQMLALGRADMTVSGRINAMLFMRQMNIHNVQALESTRQITPLFHYLHPRHRALSKKLHRVLQTMARSGTLHRLQKATHQALLHQMPAPPLETLLAQR